MFIFDVYMTNRDDNYESYMREVDRDVPGEFGVFLPMQTLEEVYDNFVPKLEGDGQFRGIYFFYLFHFLDPDSVI